MPSLVPDFATLERRLAGLPVVKHGAREVVLTAGSKTGGLLFLRSGTVEVIKDGVQIASVNAPGSVFGEQAVLLDQPHTADVRTLEQSEFYVADAPAILAGDPTVALYVAAILARRLDAANRWLVAVKRHLQTGEPPSVIGKAIEQGGGTVKLRRPRSNWMVIRANPATPVSCTPPIRSVSPWVLQGARRPAGSADLRVGPGCAPTTRSG